LTDINEVADLLHSAAIHVLRRSSEQDSSAGISSARLSALSVIVLRGPLTLGALADAEGVRSATMTGIVNGLVEEGLVRRRPHGSDRRAVLVEATGAGRRLLNRARLKRIDAVAAKLTDLSARDLEIVRRAAELLEERFAARPWQPAEKDG
jgi:DNA-binding MarR family transcriptional regulator